MAKVEPPPSEDCTCPRCARSFSSPEAFDRHRLTGRCVDPAGVPGLDRHVGRDVWGLAETVRPEWAGPFTQLEIPLPRRHKNANEKRIHK
jgi:hypothetical protein